MLLATCYLLLVSCGFHLRGTGLTQLPEVLAVLRVAVEGGAAVHDPLLDAMRDALREAGATVSDAADAPVLRLSGEGFNTQVLSVDAAGRVAEYLVRYEVSFRLTDAAGKELVPAQTIRMQRDYTFDRLNVIAKEKEEEDLRRELRRDVVRQIVRRLSKVASSK